jgi:hypothetical protein
VNSKICYSHGGDYEEQYVLRYDAFDLVCLTTFRTNMLPPLLETRRKARNHLANSKVALLAHLLFKPEDGSSTFLQNVGTLTPICTV